jgi:transposase
VPGDDERSGKLFTFVDPRGTGSARSSATIDPRNCERSAGLAGREFAVLYSPMGRALIAPEKLLRAMLLEAFYSIGSERLLMKRLEHDLVFPLVCRHRHR